METCASSLVAQPSNRGVEERRTPQPVSSANSRVELVRVANNMLYVSKSNRLRACFIDVSEDSLYESQSSLSKAGATEIACVLLSEHAFRCARVGHALNLWTSSRALRPRFLMHEFAPALLEFVRSRERPASVGSTTHHQIRFELALDSESVGRLSYSRAYSQPMPFADAAFRIDTYGCRSMDSGSQIRADESGSGILKP